MATNLGSFQTHRTRELEEDGWDKSFEELDWRSLIYDDALGKLLEGDFK